jgi:tRNA(Ile)-lysidine synthase
VSGAVKPPPASAVRPLLEPYLLKASPAITGAVLAVSGGPDSMALMRLSAELRTCGELAPVTVATVDHGLRPESGAEAETVGGWARACGFPHRLLAWTGEKPRTGLQEAARQARYLLLAGLAEEIGASHVLAAHTLDDQAETLLMRMSRGTGIAGLAGMRRETRLGGLTLARPFLNLSKAQLTAMCAAHGWPFLEDPSNADPRFARSRWRRLMPLLAREGLTAERLAALALRAQRVEDALAARTRAVLDSARLAQSDASLELDGSALLAEPEAIQLRAVAQAIAAVAGPATRPVRLERLEEHVLGMLCSALAEGARAKLNLGSALIEVTPDRRIRFTPEPPRRRGRGSPSRASAGRE